MMENDFDEREYAINLIHEHLNAIPDNWKNDNPCFLRMTDCQKQKVQKTIDKYVGRIYRLVTPVQIDI